MDRASLWEWTRRALLAPSTLEEDRSFRITLARIALTGLQWGGLLGILVVVGLVLLNSLLLGRPTTWWYPPSAAPDAFVLWDKAVGALLSGLAVWTGRVRGRLPTARSVGAAIALTVVAVALTHDVYRGVLSIEYVILTYLLAVTVIPYRPWQSLLIGGTITGMLAGPYALSPASIVTDGTLIRMGLVTLVLTGVSSLLYVIRLRQHRARQETERLHRRVAQLEQAKSQFFADVAHEFRTPLTLILGSLREALDGRLGTLPSDLQDRLASLDAQARRMRRLVNQLLELSQLDEGRLSVSMQPQPVGALVDRLTVAFRDWAETKGLTFQAELEGDGPEAWLDPNRLESILANLLSNAIKYTPAGGTVRVRVDATDSAVAISVRDTGPGLPDEVRARVFDRHTSTLPVGKATDAPSPDALSQISMGIGLAHTKALVERHQGTLHVESEPGFGTECIVRLPLGSDHVPDADRAASADEGVLPIGRWMPHRGCRLSSLLLPTRPTFLSMTPPRFSWSTTRPTCARTSSACFGPTTAW
jgi:signal transduction histidine kinase